MYLSELAIQQFRCLDEVMIQPSQGLNLILGENGSGKTSLLEAIYSLSRGKSFRSKELKKLIQDHKAHFVVRSKLEDDIQYQLAIQVKQATTENKSGFLAKINGQELKTKLELNRLLPVILLDPGVHKLIEEGPKVRREYIDWGTFHVEQEFITVWRRYQQALKQRNHGLKQQLSVAQLKPWTDILLETGQHIHRMRLDYLAMVTPIAEHLTSELLQKEVKFSYRAGWAQGLSFQEALEKSQPRELQFGLTRVGPHRADLVVQIEGEVISNETDSDSHQESDQDNPIEAKQKLHQVKQRVSRGQQKLIASAMKLAQAEHFKQNTGKSPILLIDDPFAELDQKHSANLLEKISGLGSQCFITTLQGVDHPIFAKAMKFHVEHGSVRQI